MVVAISVSVPVRVIVVTMIIYRTSIIIVTSIIVTEMGAERSWNPTSVYPAVASAIIFPIARNPVCIGVRR
jgi:hypothetical protein